VTTTASDEGSRRGRVRRMRVLPLLSDEEWERRVAELDLKDQRTPGHGKHGGSTRLRLYGHQEEQDDWTSMVDALIERDYMAYVNRGQAVVSDWIKGLKCPGCGGSSFFMRRDKVVGRFAEGTVRYQCGHHCGGEILKALDLDTRGARHPEVRSAEDDFDDLDEDEAPVFGGWAPVDLAATVAGLLDGTITRPEPTLGHFGDGCLFYPGRINSVHGDSTAGKTWTALVTARQEIARGETVVYVDLEDSAEGVVSRLMDDLGAPPDAVRDRFVYLHPDERLTPAAATGLAALLDARRPSLVVVDSTGEALAVEGANPNADEEVARWFRLLPRLAVRCGAAVLLLDHATKAGDNDLWPIGSQRKRAAVTGAAYLQRVVQSFGQDQDGKSVLVCAKDRHGNYPLGRRVAALTVRGGEISLAPEARAAADFQPTGYMEKVSRFLEAAPEPQSGRQVLAAVPGKKVHKVAALAALVKGEFVAVADGPRGAQMHTSAKPYREGDDDLL
jgi:ribosomal protein S27AE